MSPGGGPEVEAALDELVAAVRAGRPRAVAEAQRRLRSLGIASIDPLWRRAGRRGLALRRADRLRADEELLAAQERRGR